jgi:hypothetical protein
MPQVALPQTTKNIKQKQPKSQKPPKTIKSYGNHSKNKQNQQNHQKPPHLIEIKKGMVGDAPPTKNH